MSVNFLPELVRYHIRVDERILDQSTKLSDEEFRREGTTDNGSALDTLLHMLIVDWSWREFCTGNDIGQAYVWDLGFVLDDLPAIHAFSLEEDDRLRSYVESLGDAGLNEPMKLSEDPDDVVPRWLILAHVVNHGTQHRSELARYLTECGHSPGELDLVDAPRLSWPVER